MLLLISNVCHGSIGDSHLEPKVNFLRIPAISKVQEVGEEYNLRGVQETYPVMPSLLDTVQSISFWPLHDKWAGLCSITKSSSLISSNKATTSHFNYKERKAEDPRATTIFYVNFEQNFWSDRGTSLILDTVLSTSFPVISLFLTWPLTTENHSGEPDSFPIMLQ